MKSDRGSSSSFQRSARAWSAPPRGDMFRDSATRESRFVGEPSPIHLFPSVLMQWKRGEMCSVVAACNACGHAYRSPFAASTGGIQQAGKPTRASVRLTYGKMDTLHKVRNSCVVKQSLGSLRYVCSPGPNIYYTLKYLLYPQWERALYSYAREKDASNKYVSNSHKQYWSPRTLNV